MVQEIESVTGVKTEFKKPIFLSNSDSKDSINKETVNITNKRQNIESDNVMNLMTSIHTHGLAHNHVLSVDMFSKEQLNEIFNLAQTLRVYVIKGRPLDNILKVCIRFFVFIEFYLNFSCRVWLWL